MVPGPQVCHLLLAWASASATLKGCMTLKGGVLFTTGCGIWVSLKGWPRLDGNMRRHKVRSLVGLATRAFKT